MKKLELIREEKLFRLIPGRTKNSRLEASGIALVNDSTAFIVFDNLNQIARVDVSLKRSRRNSLWHAPSLGAGFEDVAADARLGSTFGLIEAVEDLDGVLRGFVAEYDHEGLLRRCTRLPGKFQKANKGFEGLAHARHNGREHLYALREANSSASGASRGRIDVYVRASQRRVEGIPSDCAAGGSAVQGLFRARVSAPPGSDRLAGVGTGLGGAAGCEETHLYQGIGWRVSLSGQELRQCRRH